MRYLGHYERGEVVGMRSVLFAICRLYCCPDKVLGGNVSLR